MELKELQKIISDFTSEKSLSDNLSVRTIDLVSEIGELAKEVLKGTGYGENSFRKNINFESELGDVFFSLIYIANIKIPT